MSCINSDGGHKMNSWRTRWTLGFCAVAVLSIPVQAVDTDLDGIDDQFDVCCSTPASVPVDSTGRPLGDIDQDCDVDLDDASLLWAAYTGPLNPQSACQGGGPDVDECLLNLDNCSNHATCTNTPWSFLCTCLPGFAGNGVVCNDINECAQNVCGQGGTCINLFGSYQCGCAYGYLESNGQCVDVDECLDPGLCGDAGDCVNIPGAYSCDCNTYHANCDTHPDCEVHLQEYSNTCVNAEFLGETCGDVASTFACSPTEFNQFSSTSGRGSKWLKVKVNECSGCCADLQHRFTLTVPPGTDYDLYVYSACGGALIADSLGDVDETEVVTPTLTDDCGNKDNTGYFYIEVQHYGGSSCGMWELTLEGRN